MDGINVLNLNPKSELKLSIQQRNLVLGCLLGNSSIVLPPGNRGHYFYIRQSKKEDINILAYKATFLKSFARPTAIVEDKNSIKWYSITHNEWKSIYEECYKDNRKFLTMEWLNKLSRTSFAMMFLDLGIMVENRLALNINSFKKQNNLLLQYFNEIDLTCEIKKNKLLFTKEATNYFLKIISPEVPEYLLYRIYEFF